MSDLANKYFENALTAIRGHANQHAIDLLVEAIKLKPNFVEAWIVRGNVLHSIGRPFDAALHFEKALGINDKLHDAHNNLGLCFGDLGLFASAEASFRRSAEINDSFEPHMGLANMFCTIMRLEEAAAEYRKAVELSGSPEAHFNLGVTLLGLGRWEEGFREYEHRWDNTPYPPRSYRNYKKWRGEDLNGKRILLYPEQGYGDEIMALRFANTIEVRYPDATVVLQCRAPMLRLARASGYPAIPLYGDEDQAMSIDFSSPLLDVPMMLGMKWPDVSHTGHEQIGYVSANGREVGDWKRRLATLPAGLNVGLCWSAGGHLNTARASQKAKSIPLPWLKPLAMPGVNLISLQLPRETIPPDMPITDWMQDVHDFADTAALIEALDLVITVDTAVAHLAGALGKPVWNFVRFSGYWPWLAEDVAPSPEHAIWYPSMKLFRQPRLLDWNHCIQAAASRLMGECQQRLPREPMAV